MRVLTTKADFLDWLAEQLKRSQPQTKIPEGIIYILEDVISIFNEFGCFNMEHKYLARALLEALGMVGSYPTYKVCSQNVLYFLDWAFRVSIANNDIVTRECAMMELMKLIGLKKDLLRRRRIGGQSYLLSTSKFEAKYGLAVRVKYRKEAVRRRVEPFDLGDDFFKI